MTQCLTVPCLAMVKLSIGLFLLRLAATKSYRHLCVGFLVFMGTYSLGSTFTIIFQCFPVEKVWNYSAGGKCMPIKSRVALGYSYSIITIISDFFLVLVPIPMLWHVKIPRRQRAAVCGVLSIGTFAASASIVKCLYLVNYGKTGDFLCKPSRLPPSNRACIDARTQGTASISAPGPSSKSILASFRRASPH